MTTLTNLEILQMKGSVLDNEIQLKIIENSYIKISYAIPLLTCLVSLFISLIFFLRSAELNNKLLLAITISVWILSILKIVSINKKLNRNKKEIVKLSNKIKELEDLYSHKYISLTVIKK